MLKIDTQRETRRYGMDLEEYSVVHVAEGCNLFLVCCVALFDTIEGLQIKPSACLPDWLSEKSNPCKTRGHGIME